MGGAFSSSAFSVLAFSAAAFLFDAQQPVPPGPTVISVGGGYGVRTPPGADDDDMALLIAAGIL